MKLRELRKRCMHLKKRSVDKSAKEVRADANVNAKFDREKRVNVQVIEEGDANKIEVATVKKKRKKKKTTEEDSTENDENNKEDEEGDKDLKLEEEEDKEKKPKKVKKSGGDSGILCADSRITCSDLFTALPLSEPTKKAILDLGFQLMTRLRLENIKAGRKGNLNIATEGAQADVGGMNRRSPAFTEGGSVEILEFLRKKGRSRYP
ncbi:hypothetical protein Tco_1388202 [Tanacetum coccineum]